MRKNKAVHFVIPFNQNLVSIFRITYIKIKCKCLHELYFIYESVKAIVFTGLGIIISTVLYYNGYIEGIVISVTLAAIVVLMIIGLFKMKGGVKNV